MFWFQVWNTFRDPSQTSDKWMQDLKFQTVNKIQEACKLAMKLWEYQPVDQVQLRQHVLDAKNATLKASKYKPFVLWALHCILVDDTLTTRILLLTSIEENRSTLRKRGVQHHHTPKLSAFRKGIPHLGQTSQIIIPVPFEFIFDIFKDGICPLPTPLS